MAGYSGTPLMVKLGIKAGHRVALLRPPADISRILGELPDRAVIVKRPTRDIDVVLLFARRQAVLADGIIKGRRLLAAAGGLWLCWPKRAARQPTNLTESIVRDAGLAIGLVDTRVGAIDETWSGLKFVYRLKDRAIIGA
ncbi:MAG: DUF3052 family protein [Dongiaceae bacterium]